MGDASLLSRDAGHVRYKGLAGAVLQQGITVPGHNGAVIVRIRNSRCQNAHKSSADCWA
jgi:hypothetical protein